MIDYNESQDNLVEVDIVLDCSCHIPQVGEDGTIEFQTAYPAGDMFLELNKVKVPKEAVVSQKALTRYILHKQQEWGEDFVCLRKPNIWDKGQNKDEGKFRFDEN